MALDITPTAWIAGYAADPTNVTLPIAAFSELTAGEADETTGDIRKINYAWQEKLYQAYLALPEADRPAKMTVSRYTSVNDTTGEITVSFSTTFKVESAGSEVVAE